MLLQNQLTCFAFAKRDANREAIEERKPEA
jgi:hypothetical protein